MCTSVSSRYPVSGWTALRVRGLQGCFSDRRQRWHHPRTTGRSKPMNPAAAASPFIGFLLLSPAFEVLFFSYFQRAYLLHEAGAHAECIGKSGRTGSARLFLFAAVPEGRSFLQ